MKIKYLYQIQSFRVWKSGRCLKLGTPNPNVKSEQTNLNKIQSIKKTPKRVFYVNHTFFDHKKRIYIHKTCFSYFENIQIITAS